MDCTSFLSQTHQQIVDAFISQDPTLFDVVFEIQGNKLFADKLRLSTVSSTFKSMLSDRWNSKNDAIKITEYKFENFKEFLVFIYSGKCQLTNENILEMLDIAEFYQIPYLKQLCDEYLAKMDYDIKNVLFYIKTSQKYSLVYMKKSLQMFISQNFTTILKCDEFLNASKSDILEFITFEPKPEEVFQAVYQWIEHHAIKNQKESDSINLKGIIKTAIIPFLPYFQLKKMKKYFLHSYVSQRSFVFSSDHVLREILKNFKTEVIVRITNLRGQSISGYLSHKTNETEIDIIKTLQNCSSDNGENYHIYWKTMSKIPSTPSLIKTRDGVEWYLIYLYNGNIGVSNAFHFHDKHYLLAEMHVDNQKGFSYTTKCKAEIL